MNPADRAARLAGRWVAWYTRRLPVRVAAVRRAELASDVWEQRAAQAAQGDDERAVARAIYWRVLAGAPADLSWRFAQQVAGERRRVEGRATREEAAVAAGSAPGEWVDLRLRTRRCKACNERYGRRLKYCPVCKTPRGSRGQRPPSGAGAPLGGF